MAIIKLEYPSTSSTALTISLASLATSSGLTAGRESTAIDNTSNEDLDHLLSGKIRVGTSPTAGTRIEVWAYSPISIASGTPTYPDVLDGTDSDETMTSRNVLINACVLLWTQIIDSNSNRDYFLPETSIRNAFGEMPPFWGIFVTHNTGVNLNSTGSEHSLHYFRVQKQV